MTMKHSGNTLLVLYTNKDKFPSLFKVTPMLSFSIGADGTSIPTVALKMREYMVAVVLICRGSIACLVHSLRRIPHKPTILLTFDEEVAELTGFYGVRQGSDFLKERDLMPESIMNLDGSNLVPIKGREEMMYCVLEFIGKAAHGSEPNKGDNAIHKAPVAISAIKRYAKDKLAKIEDKELGNRTINVGTVRGGDKVNQVPSWCIVELESRLLPEENGSQEAEKIKTVIEKEGLVFTRDYRFELKSWQPAYVVRNPNDPYVLAIRKALANNGLNDELTVE